MIIKRRDVLGKKKNWSMLKKWPMKMMSSLKHTKPHILNKCSNYSTRVFYFYLLFSVIYIIIFKIKT